MRVCVARQWHVREALAAGVWSAHDAQPQRGALLHRSSSAEVHAHVSFTGKVNFFNRDPWSSEYDARYLFNLKSFVVNYLGLKIPLNVYFPCVWLNKIKTLLLKWRWKVKVRFGEWKPSFQVLIASQSGQFQQLEVTAALPQNKYLFEVDLAGSYCNAIDLSSTSKALG